MHIVVGTDLSSGSIPAGKWAFDYARRLAARNLETGITVVHAAHARYPQILDTGIRIDDPANRTRIEEAIGEWVRDSVGYTEAEESLSVDVEVHAGEPSEVLSDVVDRNDSTWLAVGTTGRGALERLVVGSTAERLAHGPPCNLAICHPGYVQPDDKSTLLVGVDFTDTSAEALRLAASLARQNDAKLHVVHVVEPPTYEAYPIDTFRESEIRDMGDLVSKMNEELDYFVEEHESSLDDIAWTHRVLTGNPTGELTAFARDEDVDGIVLGTVGRSTVADFLMGSVSRGIVKHMPCSVFLSPPVD
jgi:nucleotide-binding universal stress UspA family protein